MNAKAVEADTRTGGRKRPQLTRGRILGAALDLIDRDGLEALSMRRLGAELGVEAMSLYNHLPNKDELLGGLCEVLLSEVDLQGALGKESWKEQMRQGILSFRKVLLAHPNVVPLFHTHAKVSPENFLAVEVSFSILLSAGFDPETALRAHQLIIGYTIGHVEFQINNPLGDPSRAEYEVALREENLPAKEFPALFKVLPYAVGCDFDAAFEFGIDTILSGLEQQLA